MDEKTNAAVTAGFLFAIILVFTAADLVKTDRLYSENENRILASRPQLTWETVVDGKYMEDYETYVSDQFIGRDTWVELKTAGDILAQKQEINGIYLCEDDYLIEQHLPGEIDEEEVFKKVALLQELVDEYGARALLVPTADNILSDKLPFQAQYYDQSKLLFQVEDAIGEANLINVYDTLRAHSQEDIYYRTDHHWTSLGAYYAYLEWKRQAGSTSVVTFDPAGLETVTDSFLGTLHSKINLPMRTDSIQIFPETLLKDVRITYDFTTVTDSYYEEKYLDTKNKYGYFLDDNHPFVEIETGYRRGRELVLIKNSFANCMIPLLANHYDKIYAVDLRYYNGRLSDLIDDYITPQTDVLVLYDCIHFIEDFHYYK